MNEFFGDLISVIIFSQEKGFPFEMSYSLMHNSAPRKFKNLGTDAFIAARKFEFFQFFQDVFAIKV